LIGPASRQRPQEGDDVGHFDIGQTDKPEEASQPSHDRPTHAEPNDPARSSSDEPLSA
jgi:hypothetical protein